MPAQTAPIDADTIKKAVAGVFEFAQQTVDNTARFLNNGIGLVGRTYERAYDAVLNGAHIASNPKV